MNRDTLVEKRLAVEQEFDVLNKEESELRERIDVIVTEKVRLQGKYSTLTDLIDSLEVKEKKSGRD